MYDRPISLATTNYVLAIPYKQKQLIKLHLKNNFVYQPSIDSSWNFFTNKVSDKETLK